MQDDARTVDNYWSTDYESHYVDAESTRVRVLSPEIGLLLAVAAISLLLLTAGCGSSGSKQDGDVDSIIRVADQADVAHAQVTLAKDALAGSSRLLYDSQQLAEKLRHAASDGLSSDWIDKEIDDAEETVTNVDCSDCYSVLEDARP
jgi:hypothetical protein